MTTFLRPWFILVFSISITSTGLRTDSGGWYGSSRYPASTGRLQPKVEDDWTAERFPKLSRSELLSPTDRFRPPDRPGFRTPDRPQYPQDPRENYRPSDLPSDRYGPQTRRPGGSPASTRRDYAYRSESATSINPPSFDSISTAGSSNNHESAITDESLNRDPIQKDFEPPEIAYATRRDDFDPRLRPYPNTDNYPERIPENADRRNPGSNNPFPRRPNFEEDSRFTTAGGLQHDIRPGPSTTPSPTQEVIESVRTPTRVQVPETGPSKTTHEESRRKFPPAQTTSYYEFGRRNKDQQPSVNRQPLSPRSPNQKQQPPAQGSHASSIDTTDNENREFFNEKQPVSNNHGTSSQFPSRKSLIPIVNCPEDNVICDNVPNYPRELIWEKLTSNRSIIDAFKRERSIFGAPLITPTDRSKIKPDDPDSNYNERLCEVRVDVMYPKAAKDASGKWKFVINDNRFLEQPVKIERCSSPNQSCKVIEGALGSSVRSECREKYFSNLLLTFDENEAIPKTDEFHFPVACVCYLNYALSRTKS